MKITDKMVEAGCEAHYPAWRKKGPITKNDHRASMRRTLTAALSASEELTALREAVAALDGAPREDRVGSRADVVAAARAVAT